MKAFLTVVFVVLVAACGEGRAIFNVDVQSFMAGTGKDTIPYIIPPGGGTASTFQRINLPPGFGSSGVDSVRIANGSLNLINTAGTGQIGFQFFFAADSAATLSAPAALTIPVTTVTGPQTVPVILTGDFSSTVHSLFTEEQLWIRIAATGSNSGGVAITGKGVLTALLIRVVLEDRLF
jgi:hypothetical protein